MRKILKRIVPLALLSLAACSQKAEMAKLKADFDGICLAQRNLLETKRLMKHVPMNELFAERDSKIAASLVSPAAKIALSNAQALPQKQRRAAIEKAAADAKLDSWKCPELDSF